MNKYFVGVALIAFSFMMSSCLNGDEGDDEYETLLKQTAEIDAFLDANNLTAIEDINGVRMVISELGTGFPAQTASTVDVDYVGKLFSTNQIFDDGNVKKTLSTLIKGWIIALTTLPEGSKATIYIPSYWGYGPAGNGAVPGDAILIFDIEFNDIDRSSAELQRLASDTLAIDNYLQQKAIVAEKDTTGLRFVITQLGTGTKPTLYDRIAYHSSYRLLTDDSKVVGEYDMGPTSTTYNRVIDQVADGLKLGLTKLPVGSKARFYIPSGLAFGTIGATDGGTQIIPANANVIVDVELDDIVEP